MTITIIIIITIQTIVTDPNTNTYEFVLGFVAITVILYSYRRNTFISAHNKILQLTVINEQVLSARLATHYYLEYYNTIMIIGMEVAAV